MGSRYRALAEWRAAAPVLAREAVLLTVHLALILACVSSWSAGLIFFLISWAAVCVRQWVPTRRIGLRKALAAFVLAATLIVFRTFPHILAVSSDSAAGWRPFSGITPVNLGFLGLSYCFLRSVYAVLDDRFWSLWTFARYYFFFPTFISGPIMTPQELLDQTPTPSRDAFRDGTARIIIGIMRITVAQVISPYIPLSSEHQLRWSIEHYPLPLLWLGIFLSGVWLYLNFSGYSDVFIGGARLFGITAPENFDRPYAATDLAAFWQRWHISLGNWLRTTIYTPITRRAIDYSANARVAAAVAAPIVTMIICGAWHMLSVSFLIWGALHGVGLAVHAVWGRITGRVGSQPAAPASTSRIGAWLLTHAYVALTWVFFLPVADVPLGVRLKLLGTLFGMNV